MRRRLALLGLLVLAVVGSVPAAPALAQTSAVRVAVVGIAGLRWDDIDPDRTPALSRLTATGAVGALSVKALPDVSCRGDGWLTLGAGARAEVYGARRGPCGADLPADLEGQRRRNAASRDGAVLQDVGPAQTQGAGAGLAGQASTGSPLLIVDAGGLGGPSRDRPAQLRAVDLAVARVVSELPPGADLLVVGLSEGPGEAAAHLHVAIAAGPAFRRGALRSASTRRAPYVQLIDVAPTVLSLLGRPVPADMDGEPWVVGGASPSGAALVDLDTRATGQKRATVPFFVVLIAAQLVLLGALRRRPVAARTVALAGVAAVGASYLANLVPWWRAGQLALLALLAVVLALSLAVALGVAHLTRRRAYAVGLVCGGVALVLAADLVTGARLQMSSVAGYSPLVAGRFAGLGNVAFGVFGTAAIFATACVGTGRGRRTAGALVATAGLLTVAVDGAPPWGSDVGGVLALLPAFVVLGLLLTGARVSVLRLVLAGAGGVVVVTGFALADHARAPQDRTHLGRFVTQVGDGTAGEVLRRKADAVFGLLFHSPVTAALPLVVAGLALLVLRPAPALRRALDAEPAGRPALAAVGVLSAVGFAVNDSGAAVVALALLVAVPATAALLLGVAAQHPPDAG